MGMLLCAGFFHCTHEAYNWSDRFINCFQDHCTFALFDEGSLCAMYFVSLTELTWIPATHSVSESNSDGSICLQHQETSNKMEYFKQTHECSMSYYIKINMNAQ